MLKATFKVLPITALHFLIPFFLSFAMSGIVSGISTIRAIGLANFELFPYFFSWMYSWFIAFPAALILLPIVRKIAYCFIKEN